MDHTHYGCGPLWAWPITQYGCGPLWVWPIRYADSIRDIEVLDKVDQDLRGSTPLFTTDDGKAFTGYFLDRLLRLMLTLIVGATEATKYSWHSFRIFLACALMASGATSAQIQAMCRWRSDEALAIYARTNRSAYCAMLKRALYANIDSIRTSNLPDIDEEDIIRDVLAASTHDEL